MSENIGKKPFKAKVRHFFGAAGKFKSLWQYLLFVLVAGVFWFIMALNDDMQADFRVAIRIDGVPDSVTFITDPPTELTVTVRDKGSSLLRRRFMEEPVIHIPFQEFAYRNRLRVSPSAMLSRLRGFFGAGASVNITSADSVGVYYTTSPGRVVPIRVNADVTAALGKVINGRPRLNVREARIFSVSDITDTIMYVSTMPVVRRDLTDTYRLKVDIHPIKGVRIEPSSVEVVFPVEPLENRKVFVPVTAVGVPPDRSLALFPPKVEVSYLVPMSMSEEVPATEFSVTADYADISASSSAMIKISLNKIPKAVQSATLMADSIEYTIIRNVK